MREREREREWGGTKRMHRGMWTTLGKYYNVIYIMDSRTAPTGFPQQIETRSMDMLTEFVDQLAAPAPPRAPTGPILTILPGGRPGPAAPCFPVGPRLPATPRSPESPFKPFAPEGPLSPCKAKPTPSSSSHFTTYVLYA